MSPGVACRSLHAELRQSRRCRVRILPEVGEIVERLGRPEDAAVGGLELHGEGDCLALTDLCAKADATSIVKEARVIQAPENFNILVDILGYPECIHDIDAERLEVIMACATTPARRLHRAVVWTTADDDAPDTCIMAHHLHEKRASG